MSVEAPVSARGLSFEAAPAVTISSVVNEGPVGPGFRLEDTMPLVLGEIKFNGPQVEEVDSGSEEIPGSSDIPSVFLEAFDPNAKAKKIWDELTAQETPTPEMFHRAFLAAAAVGKSPQTFGWPRADLEYVTSVLQDTTQETALIKAAVPYLIPHPLPQNVKVHEILEERQKKRKKDNSFVALEEEIEANKKRFVIDERALGVVIVEISAAVRKAAALAQELGRKLTGSLIARFLPGQHPGNESEVVKGKGPDGSIPERAQAIKNHGEYANEAEAKEKSIKEAYGKPPVKLRREGEGEPVKDEDVYRVFQGLEVKPSIEDLEVERLTATKVEVITEPRINDYPDLAKVFEMGYDQSSEK